VEPWELNGYLVSAPTRHNNSRLRVLSLEAELHSQIAGEVRFDGGSRALVIAPCQETPAGYGEHRDCK
jgi:hypothetical protein